MRIIRVVVFSASVHPHMTLLFRFVVVARGRVPNESEVAVRPARVEVPVLAQKTDRV